MRVKLVLAVVLAGVSGCATVAKVTEPVAEAAGSALLTDQQLQQLGNRMSTQVKSEMQVLRDPQVQQYVDAVARQVLSTVPRDQRRFNFEFTVLDEPKMVNAFALPGGHIYVTTALIEAMESEAQLAAVLAHEIAHVTRGHVEEQIAAQYGFGLLQELALGKNPGMLAQIASGVAGKGYLAAYSRQEESDADATGLEYLVEAGYTPGAMVQFMNIMAEGAQERPAVFQFFASHPAPTERARELAGLIQERGYQPARTSIVGGFQQIQAQVHAAPSVGQVRGTRIEQAAGA